MKQTFKLTLIALTLVTFISCEQEDIKSYLSKNDKIENGDSYKLDYQTAKRYVANYAAHAGYVDQTASEIQSKAAKRPETRSIWFSKERLQSMLDQLENEKGDGVRFYLATYDNVPMAGTNIPQEHLGFNTLLMVSTKDSVAGSETFHRDYYNTTGAVSTIGFVENKGEICPPPADCINIGATLIGN